MSIDDANECVKDTLSQLFGRGETSTRRQARNMLSCRDATWSTSLNRGARGFRRELSSRAGRAYAAGSEFAESHFALSSRVHSAR